MTGTSSDRELSWIRDILLGTDIRVIAKKIIMCLKQNGYHFSIFWVILNFDLYYLSIALGFPWALLRKEIYDLTHVKNTFKSKQRPSFTGLNGLE